MWPVGASKGKRPDVRIIAATNRDIRRMIDEGSFPQGSLLGGRRLQAALAETFPVRAAAFVEGPRLRRSAVQ